MIAIAKELSAAEKSEQVSLADESISGLENENGQCSRSWIPELNN